jgi:hypothetical protein
VLKEHPYFGSDGSPKLQFSYCVFMDVLGFSKMIHDSFAAGIGQDLFTSYCQELCTQGSRGVLRYPEAVLEGHAVHDLRQILRGP